MARTKTSNRWLQEHFSDIYVQKAHAEGYRSRAVYKLQEVDDKETLFRPGMTVVDLGSAPGGWAQYVSKKLNGHATIIALDLLPISPLPSVTCLQGDFREDEILQKLMEYVPAHTVDVLLSDMAPNMSGYTAVDIPRAMYLAELAYDFSHKMLKPGGTLFMKIFHGTGFDEIVKQARCEFERVVIKKPKASRARSRETYLLAKGYGL